MAAATVFTNKGRALLTAREIATSGVTAILAPFMAFGKGVTTALVTSTALNTELTTGDVPSYARVAVTGSQVTTSVTNDTYQQVGTLNANGAGTAVAITECATFDALTVGNIFLYATFAAVNVVANDTLQITFTLQHN